MAPSFCALNNCSNHYQKGKNVYIKQVKSLKFIKKDTDEYNHQVILQKCILSYRDSNNKHDSILSQIHRGQCGICERHFKDSDILICKL